MAEVSLARGLVICSDEIHGDLVYEPYRHLPIASLDDEIARRTVTLMAPSKTFNIPGLGFSFAIIEDRELRKQYKDAARDIVPHINALGYTAALAAYTDAEPWLASCIEYLRENRDFLARFVEERLAGVRMVAPEATYLAWLDFSGAQLGQDPHKYFLEQAGVALNEAAPFGPGSEGFARLNFACPRSLLVEALERMESALRAGRLLHTN
jgi:cystathionine beta-lyase